MATYVVEQDSYAGWNGAGRSFGLFGLAAGAVWFASWAATHGPHYASSTIDPASQLFLFAMTWIGGGVFVVMAMGVMGSLMLSAKSRGTVTIDDVGVTRQIGKRIRILRWEEIDGFVAMAYGGVTLIPRTGDRRIEIPRFLDDYRGCIAELKARGLRGLPIDRLARSLRQGSVRGWRQWLLVLLGVEAWMMAYSARGSHGLRVIAVICSVVYCLGLTVYEHRWADRFAAHRWTNAVVFALMLAWLLIHMARTW